MISSAGNYLTFHERKPVSSHRNSDRAFHTYCVSSYVHSCLLNWTRGSDRISRDRHTIEKDVASDSVRVLRFQNSAYLSALISGGIGINSILWFFIDFANVIKKKNLPRNSFHLRFHTLWTKVKFPECYRMICSTLLFASFQFKYLTERSYYAKRIILEIHEKIELNYLAAIMRTCSILRFFSYTSTLY